MKLFVTPGSRFWVIKYIYKKNLLVLGEKLHRSIQEEQHNKLLFVSDRSSRERRGAHNRAKTASTYRCVVTIPSRRVHGSIANVSERHAEGGRKHLREGIFAAACSIKEAVCQWRVC